MRAKSARSTRKASVSRARVDAWMKSLRLHQRARHGWDYGHASDSRSLRQRAILPGKSQRRVFIWGDVLNPLCQRCACTRLHWKKKKCQSEFPCLLRPPYIPKSRPPADRKTRTCAFQLWDRFFHHFWWVNGDASFQVQWLLLIFLMRLWRSWKCDMDCSEGFSLKLGMIWVLEGVTGR